jgi:hypothetical protein
MSKYPTGELPLSIIKMKAQGCNVLLSGNTGFTLPTNTRDLGDITTLDLSRCSLLGEGRIRAIDLHQYFLRIVFGQVEFQIGLEI